MTGRLRERCGRVLSFFRKPDLDREFDDEARSHLALAVEDYLQRGLPHAEAERLARVKFGAIEASKDAHRDSRGLPWLEGLLFDVRYALRGLRRDRVYTLASVATLALAIALNVTVFTIVDAALFRGYPLVKKRDRLVFLQERDLARQVWGISYADFEEWRSQAHAMQGMAFVSRRAITVRAEDGRASDAVAYAVSASTFGLLHVSPMLGRDFVTADEAPGSARVAILNYRSWESRFGKRADIVGATLQIDRQPTTVIGVMPQHFDFPSKEEELWVPLAPSSELRQRGRTGFTSDGFMAFGRLKDGVDAEEARVQLETIQRRLEAAYPATNRGVVLVVEPGAPGSADATGSITYGAMWAGAWFVLLIACVNLANLTLVRTMARSRELSTRVALGAGRGRVMRQIGLECLVVAGLAGTLGWYITTWSVNRWALATASLYEIRDHTVNAGTVAYLAAVTVFAAIACSIVPISRVMTLGISGALKGEAAGTTPHLRGKRLTGALVAGQMMLAIVLLSGAGILVRSLLKIVNAETGVRAPEHVLAAPLRLPLDKYRDPATRPAYFDRVDAQLRTIPGIESVSVASTIPVNWPGQPREIEIEGSPTPASGGTNAYFVNAGSGYFRVLGAHLMPGRDFNDGDTAATQPVAIVNQHFADIFWPREQPLGKRFRAKFPNQATEWRTVVGVASNIMQGASGDATRQQFTPLIYVPMRQISPTRAFVLVRTGVPVAQMAPAIRDQLQTIDRDVLLGDVNTLKANFAFDRDRMDAQHSELGKFAALAPVFAVVALLLAAIGLSAVIAHSVARRTKEIGIRMAIGATAKEVRWMVLREGMVPVAGGVVLGLGASALVNRVLQSQLVGISPYDPVTVAGAPLVLVVVALIACQIPARRAIRVDPVIALRHE